MVSAEFPILGTEPLVVELANTLYGAGEEEIDFLRTAQGVSQWFARTTEESATAMGRDAERVRALRDAVHLLFRAAVDGSAPDRAAIALVNGVAQAAPTSLELDWPQGGKPSTRWRDTTTGSTAALGRIAACCIELLAGPSAENLRRCTAPGCSMFFVRNHSRRRWCHPSCGHRNRQARYYRRRRSREVSG